MIYKPKIRFVVIIILLAILGSAAIGACRKDHTALYPSPTPISFTTPTGFPQPLYTFTNNPLTEEGFELGRKLFHDHNLSKGIDVNCGSCHQQPAAYTTFDHDLGHGTNHQHTSRNVPGIFNMVWAPAFQWDGSVANLEDQSLTCMTAPEKMGETVDDVVNKLKNMPEYPPMFGKAFGSEEITGHRIALAITQFVASIVSADSKYDRVKKGEESFNASEQNGYAIFQSKCANCHAEPLFTDWSYRNDGLTLDPYHNDFGRMRFTKNPADSLKFKVPSLRNVALTAYYTHDGRFEAISEMLDHYSQGIVDGPTLDPLLKNKIPLTDLEKFYLQEFLFTLSDSTMVNNKRFEVQ